MTTTPRTPEQNPIIDQPIRQTPWLDYLRTAARDHAHGDNGPPAHHYSNAQSSRDPSQDAVYLVIDQADHASSRVFIAAFDNSLDAGYAAAALNRARPVEYSLVDSLTRPR